MKRFGNLWDKMCSEEVLLEAMDNAAKGKMKYRAVAEKMRDPMKYVRELRQMLLNDEFTPSEYKADIIKSEYGKVREIFKLPYYPDRVIQHAISIVLRPRWNKSMTADTYACLVGRGINAKNSRFNLNKKIKRVLNNRKYKGHPLYCLKMDIKKCYPSVDNEILAKINRKYCKDEKLLELMDKINFAGKGLPIGNFISQLWINILLTEVDHYIKEQLHVKHYFRYLDDFVIISDDKHELHELQWRIMFFLYYKLNMVMNNKRQIFKIGENLTERGIDFVGYVFRRSGTRLRKRIKRAFMMKRNKPKSVPSYMGIAMYCDSRNLINKITNTKDATDMGRDIRELGIKISRPFEGDNLRIEQVVDKEIEILDYEIRESKKTPGTRYLKMQVRFEGKKRFIGGGYSFLCDTLEQIDKSQLPINVTVKNKRGYYFEGTLDES